MKKLLVLVLISCAGCTGFGREGAVMDNILMDFGLRDKPEGHQSGSERVFDRLTSVGRIEMKRLNAESRHGETKFLETAGLKGRYYREVKVYENFFPLDVQNVTKGEKDERGYVGFIEFAYRTYQSERTSNRTQAAAAVANVRTDETGRDTYRYNFSMSGNWNNAKGERVRKK